jgi:propionate CoA-transferase
MSMKVLTAKEAAALVESGWTVACAGFVGAGHAEAVTSALEQRFLETSLPRDLTLVYSAGQGDRKTRGVNRFGNPGMTTAVCGGHWRSATRLQRMALDEQCEAYSLPQGVVTHLYRAIAGGQPGVLTRVGLHTFVDPRTSLDARYQGGALNETAVAALAAGRAPWVKSVEAAELGGEEMLFYPSFPIHCALIRATSADPRGNLSTHDEAFHHELLALAQATRNSGGIVVAQVRQLVDRHEALGPIRVPGVLVDYVVVSEDPLHHQMTFGEDHNPSYLVPWRGEGATHSASSPSPPSAPSALDARTIAQRRAVLEIQRRAPRVVNLGVGMPALIGGMAHAAGLEGFTLTVEAGPFGGTPADGLSFGASAYPEAVVDQPAQFDFYDGGGIDLAVLGMAELDARGDLNVSRFGEGERRMIAGVGGFINITQGARAVIFVGTLTAGGLKVAVEGGQLRIVAEGHSRKIVEAVSHLSFNAAHIARKHTPVLYITERAVFETRLDEAGVRRLTLVEIAPGIDLQRDVLDRCDTTVAVAPELQTMDARVFAAGPFRLT